MVKKVIFFSILFICVFTLVGSQQRENIFAEEQNKSNAVKDISKYLKMRLDYSQSKKYNPYDSEVGDIRGECAELTIENKFKEVAEKANRGLEKDKYNIQLLIALANAYRKLGDIENANKYRILWMGLVDSIMASGDGKSPEIAFKVISVAEEYALLMVLKLEWTGKQSLAEINGSEFDILTVKDIKTGAVSELYFNVDIPFKWLLKKNQAEEK
ncbi:MAG: DUF4919 domain-containing protein [Candidatus Omnitrophota bacterium]|nr:DUF4919 domain-containing protein [Candidatus Omnitrophota bacterium]